jgi:putative transposase
MEVEGRTGAARGRALASGSIGATSIAPAALNRPPERSSKIPKRRKVSYFPAFLESRRMASASLAAVVQEAHARGVSPRFADDLIKAMEMSGIAKSQVSRLCEEFGATDGIGARKNNRIVLVAAIVSIGVDADARRREVPALAIGPSQALTFWTDFPRQLRRRGGARGEARRLRRTRWHQSRGRRGDERKLNAAASASVRFMRNILAAAGKRGRRVVAAFMATAFAQDDALTAKAKWRKVAGRLRQKLAKLAKLAALTDAAEAGILAS